MELHELMGKLCAEVVFYSSLDEKIKNLSEKEKQIIKEGDSHKIRILLSKRSSNVFSDMTHAPTLY